MFTIVCKVICSDTGIEKKKVREKKKVLPNAEDRTPTVRLLRIANIAPVTAQ